MNTSSIGGYSVSNPLFQKYVGIGFSFSLLWLYTPLFVLGLIGIVLNGSLVYVTWKCRVSLNGLFNVLIAVESFASLCWETSYVFPWFIALSGVNLVSAELCFYLQFVSNWGVNMQIMTMMFVSLERLFCIIFPIWSSKERNVKLYKVVLNLISFTLGFINNIIIYVGILNEFQEKLVLCFLGDNRSVFARLYSFRVNVCLEIITVLVYALIWLQMAKGTIRKVKITSTHNMNILKCVTIIILFVMFGWALNGLNPFYLPLLKLSPEDTINFSAGLVQLTLIASASNAPVLYMFSGEYRRCFQKTFPWLAKKHTTTAVSTVQMTSSTNMARRQVQAIPTAQNASAGLPVVVN